MNENGLSRVEFYFDPVCPWAYRTSLWIRNVREIRPIDVDWKFLSLRAINAGKASLKETHSMSTDAFRVMALARREAGNDAVDRMYAALGKARFDREEHIGKPDVLKAALRDSGLREELYDEALSDDSTQEDVQRDHDAGVACGAFGVPTLVLEAGEHAFFGPVISKVPEGESAGEFWDHFSWIVGQPEFCEIKRER